MVLDGPQGQSLGIISSFWGRSLKGLSIQTGGISRASGTGILSVRFWVAQRGSLGLRFGGDGAQGWGEAAPRGVGAHESA